MVYLAKGSVKEDGQLTLFIDNTFDDPVTP